MVISNIGTKRFSDYQKWDEIVFEWEDVFVRELGIGFHKTHGVLAQRLYRKFPFLKRFFLPRKLTFMYQIVPSLENNIYNDEKIIPCIIDYYLDEDNTRKFLLYYNKVKLLCISSKEIYDYLNKISYDEELHLPLLHLPLSISDKYRLSKETRFEKKYDLVSVGRINPILFDFLKKYKENHPSFVYVYNEGNKCDFKYFTSEGECLGKADDRESYLGLMRMSKCGLYSTPGIDGGEKYTNGFSQVTPRFLEYLTCRCHVIARYKENSDTDYFELNKMTLPANNYEEFEKSLDYALNSSIDVEKYMSYLDKHYTSVIVNELKEYIKNK